MCHGPRLLPFTALLLLLLLAASSPRAVTRAWADDLAHAIIPNHPSRDGSALLVGDFNGDSQSDLAIVESPEAFPTCLPCPSRVDIYFGPLAARVDGWRPDVVLTHSVRLFQLLGGVVGDVNGDKIDDLILGRWVECSMPMSELDPQQAQDTVVVLGARDWPASRDLSVDLPDVRITRGLGDLYAWPETCGDLDGDGIGDLIVSTGQRSHIWYGRSQWPATLDTSRGAADLEITGTSWSTRIRIVDTDGGRALLIGNASLVRMPSRRLGLIDAVADANVRVLCLAADAPATTWRPGPGEPIRLVVTDDVDPSDTRAWRYAPRILRLIDITQDGVVELRGTDDPPQVVGTILGAQLVSSPHVGSSPGSGDALLVASATLPRLRGLLEAGGLAMIEPGILASGSVDVRYGRGSWHVYGVATQSYFGVDPVAVGDLTGDRRDDIVTFAGDAVIVLDGARRPAVESSPVIHVDGTLGDDGQDGATWATAQRSLARALQRAEVASGDPVIKLAASDYVVPAEILYSRVNDADAVAVLGQGTWLLGGYAPGGATRDPELFVSSMRVTVEAWRGTQGRLAMGSFDPDAGRPALADGLVLESAWLQGPAVLSTSRIRGASVESWVSGFCDDWSGTCVPDPGSHGNAAVTATGNGAWIWNCHVSATRAYEHAMCYTDCVASVGGSIVRLGSAAHLVGTTIEGVVAGQAVIDDRLPGTTLLRDILWDNGGAAIRSNGGGVYSHLLFHDTSWPAIRGTSLIDADPLLIGGQSLSHRAAGQTADSPAIDAGDVAARAACAPIAGLPCLASMSTRTDRVPDEGIADLGFHAYVPPTWSAPLAAASATCGARLAWSAPDAFVSVRVFRSRTPDVPLAAPVAIVSGRDAGWTDATLSHGESAWYRVVGIDAFGDEWPCAESVVLTGRDAMSPELSVSTLVQGCDVTLLGSVSDDCSGAMTDVDIFGSEAPDFAPSAATRLAARGTLPWRDSRDANGLMYYRVVARDAVGNAATSEPVEARLDGCAGAMPVPGLVPMLRVHEHGAVVSCTFDGAPGATAHHVLQAPIDGLRGPAPWRTSWGVDGTALTADDEGACGIASLQTVLPSGPGSVAWVVVGENASGLGPVGGSHRPVTIGCR